MHTHDCAYGCRDKVVCPIPDADCSLDEDGEGEIFHLSCERNAEIDEQYERDRDLDRAARDDAQERKYQEWKDEQMGMGPAPRYCDDDDF